MKRTLLLSVFLLAAALFAAARYFPHTLDRLPFLANRDTLQPNDWPHWRGPGRNDVSKETGLLQVWPAGGPKLLWLSHDAGIGYTAPAIAGGRLYTAGGIEKSEDLFCFDAATGKKLWECEIGDLYKNEMGNGPRGTPTVDGRHVYMMSGQGNIVCVRAADGKIVWEKDASELGGKVPRWGYGESVLVDGDRLLCTPGGAAGSVVALDKATGKVIWQSKEMTDAAHYSSLAPTDLNGQHQYVQFTKTHVFGIAAADGKLLWQQDFVGLTVIPTPIVRPPYVYVTAGGGSGCMLLKINPDYSIEKVYFNKVMKNYHGGVILLGDYLYGHSDPGGWTCQDFLSGKQIWAERNILGKGSLTYADGRAYCVEEEKGEVALVDLSPEGFHEKGRFTLAPQSQLRTAQGKLWSHPVVSHGRLYLRDQELLYCFDVRAH